MQEGHVLFFNRLNMEKSNLLNQKFGKLTVLEEFGKTPVGHITWKCLCDCGNTVVRTGTSIKRSKYSSCGCFTLKGNSNPLWKGFGEISAAWFYDKVVRAAKGYKGGRKIKEITIDVEYIWNLFLKQNRKCIYTNIELTFPITSTSSKQSNYTASLDRIDSNKGYIKGNVQWVHKKINIMKNIYSHDEFVTLCNLVSENNKKEELLAGGACEIN